MSQHPGDSSHDDGVDAKEIPLPELEFDQPIAPRPEEEIAVALRSTPDTDGQSRD